MYGRFKNTTFQENINQSHFREDFEKVYRFPLKITYLYTLLVYDLEFTPACWSATSGLLHLNHF